MEFVDTHCHIQEVIRDTAENAHGEEALVHNKWAKAGITDPQSLIDEAAGVGVTRLMLVGCSLRDSERAIALATKQPKCWASVGIHPHEAKEHLSKETQRAFAALASDPLVKAVGECGLDYFYAHSSKEDQFALLEFQLQLAQDNNLPVIFHVREAFDDFWPIFDNFKGLRGVIHSFSADSVVLEQILTRSLYVGLNGIMTFTKDQAQLAAAKLIPLESMVLETDAPFLTPTPERGTICKPKHIVLTAEFLAGLRDESIEQLANVTTQNACNLFGLN
jgi:TatD DNase family protein